MYTITIHTTISRIQMMEKVMVVKLMMVVLMIVMVMVIGLVVVRLMNVGLVVVRLMVVGLVVVMTGDVYHVSSGHLSTRSSS